MRARAIVLFPFAICVVLPPAGLVLALAQFAQDRELGVRLLGAVLVGIALWTLLLLK